MSQQTKRLLLGIAVGVAAVFAVAVAVNAFGGKETATKAEYQATVVNARDRVDFAYAQITKADSVENLIERLDEAGAAIGQVAEDVGDAPVAEGFEGLNDRLADKLFDFSGALHATAEQFRDPTSGGLLDTINSLGFEEWDEVNAILTEMQEKGIEVKLLERH